MRRPVRSIVRSALAGLALAALTGCAAGRTQAPAAATGPGAGETPREIDPDLLAQIQQTASDLESLENLGAEPEASTPWEPAPVTAARPRANVAPPIEIDEAPPVDRLAASEAVPAPATSADPAEPETVDRAVRRLAAALRADPELDPIRVYAAMAALEVVEPGAMVNPSSIEGLTPEDARILEAWAELMREAETRLTSAPGDPRGLADAIVAAAETADGFEPLTITDARLCSRVEGFGRYSPMRTTWLAGRTHRAIAYAEVDRFASAPAVGPGGELGYEVRLTQELQLFHDADGLLAWRMPPQDVVDFSRNRRRDFFVVQMINLPATLSVGRYQLKISIRDEATREISETVIPIHIVADEALIGPEPN